MNCKRNLALGLALVCGCMAQAQLVQYASDASGNLVQRAGSAATAPQIIGQPQPQIVVPGGYATFSVLLADSGGGAFQWRFFGTNLPGQTGDSLLLLNVTSNLQGPYSVVVTNGSGSVTSAVAPLYIDSVGNGMPDSWELTYFGNLNQNATGDFDGDGISNLQEFLDGTNPTNKTSFRARLMIQADGGSVVVAPAQSSYALTDLVTLTGSPLPPNSFAGWTGDLVTRSNPASLLMSTNKSVRACFNCQPAVAGLVGWWRGEGDLTDFVGGHDGMFYSGTNAIPASITATGMVGGAFQFYGTNYIATPDAADLKPAQLTLEAWIFPTIQSGTYQTVVAKDAAVNDDDAYYLGVLNGVPYFWTKHSGGLNAVAGGTVSLLQWSHLVATFDGSAKRLYVNGLLVAVQTGFGPLTYDAPVPLTIGADWVANGPNYLFNGLLDEVSVFNRALSATEINGLYVANASGKCGVRPIFTSAPQFTDARQGAAYTQNVTTVLGALPVTYSLSAGALPPGLGLSAAGVLSGIPTVAGSNVFGVLATDAVGVSTEWICSLRVLPTVPAVIAMPAGLVSWWRAENNALDAVATNHGAISNGVTFTAGEVGQAFRFTGATNQEIRMTASPSLDIGTNAGLTFESWIKPADLTTQFPLLEWNDGTTVGLHFWLNVAFSGLGGSGCFYANLRDTSAADHYLFSPIGLLSTNNWQHVALTYDQTSGIAQLFLNGVSVSAVNLGVFVPRTTANLHLGYRPGYLSYAGLLDEPAIYNRALSTSEIFGLYNAGALGKVSVGPYLNTLTNLPDAVIAQSYTQSIVAVRGTAPISFALTGGALPPGLGLTSSGSITGAPTTLGNYSFTIQATDAALANNSQIFTLQVFAPLPPPPGIVSWWRAESNAFDAIGTNHGTLRGGAGFASGKAGRAFALDGTSQAVDIADAPALRSPSLSIEGWILWNSASGVRMLFSKAVGPGLLDSFSVWYDNGNLRMIVGDSNSFAPTISAPFTPVVGQWYHVAMTFDDATRQQVLYTNGLPCVAAFVNHAIGYDNHPLMLGRDDENGAPAYYFPGRIDETAFYNRSLGTGEITALYNAGPGGKTVVGPYFTNSPVLTAVQDELYAVTLGTARGSGAIGYALVARALPAGLTLNSLGVLSGAPNSSGNFSFTVRATDALARSADQLFSLQVSPRLAPPAGIAAWWRAENNGLDAIGTNNAILINNTTYAPGAVGQAFLLSGANDALKIPDAPALHPTSVTLESWVLFNTAAGIQFIFAKPLAGGGLDSFALLLNNGVLDGTFADFSGFAPDVTAPFAPVPGQWYHVAYTFDDATKQQTLYLNGTAVNSGFANKSIAYDASSVELGRDIENGAPAYFLSGRIDEAAIYSRALSPGEIAAIYNAGAAGKSFAGPYFTGAPILPPGAVSQGYTQALTSIRGAAPVAYSRVSGALPSGLSLSSDGILSGVPTVAGIFNFTVRATDATALFGEESLSLTISGPVAPPGGLISWWRAEGDAQDVTGNNPGILRNGVAFGPGHSGQGFVLDGIDMSVDVPDAPSLRPSSVTLEAWVLFNAAGTRVIMGKPAGTGTSDSYQIFLSGGNLGAFVGDINSPGTGLSVPFSPVFGQWYHLAFTFDGPTRQQVLYLNGVTVAAGLGNKPIGYDASPLLLGRDVDNGSAAYFLQGRLDEAAIYGRALSAPEIAAQYQAGAAGKTVAGPYFLTLPVLPDAILATPYSQILTTTRGALPVGFSLVGGALPAGLTLTPAGLLSGTPTVAGQFNFNVRVTDAASLTATQGFALTVFAPLPAPSGLLAWWQAESNALDSVGTNHGTLSNNVTFATGKVGTAFNLDGLTGNVQVTNASAFLNPTGPFSVEAWIKASPQQFSSDGLFLVVDKSHGFADGSGWVMEGNADGTMGFYFGKGGNSAPANFVGVSTTSLVRDDFWHHIVGVFTGTQIGIYEDGVLQNSIVNTNLPVGNNRNVEIGRSWGGGNPTRYFHGLIDEVSYYGRDLSAAEVAALYQAGPAGKTLNSVTSMTINAAQQAGALVLSFATTTGKNYTIQYRDSLSSGTWQTLTNLVALGSSIAYTNSVALPQQRFFRFMSAGN